MHKLTLYFSLFCCGISSALAQEEPQSIDDIFDLSLEELLNLTVSTSSGKEESILQATTNITVITRAQIEAWGVTDLMDLLERVAGIYVTYDRDEWVPAFRGNPQGANESWLFLVDGHVPGRQRQPSLYTKLPRDLENIKRVEIIKGPGSFAWGARATSGVINLISKDVDDIGRGHLKLRTALGQDQTKKVNAQYGEKLSPKSEFVMMAGFSDTDGYLLEEETSSAAVNNNIVDYGNTAAPYGKASKLVDLIDKSNYIQLKISRDNLKLNILSENFTGSNWFFEKDRQLFWGANYQQISLSHYWPAKKLSLNINHDFFQEKRGFLGQELIINGSPQGPGYDRTHHSVEKWSTQLRWERDINSTLLADTGVTASNTRKTFSDSDILADYVLEPWLRFDKALGPKLRATIGTMLTHRQVKDPLEIPDDQINTFSNRVALNWKVRKFLSHKIMFNDGFQPVRLSRLGNDEEVRKIRQIEWQSLVYRSKYDISLSIYQQSSSNQIKPIANVTGEQSVLRVDIGAIDSQGLELGVKSRVFDKHKLWFQMAWSNNSLKDFDLINADANSFNIDNDGDVLSYPELMFNASDSYKVNSLLTLSSSIRYIGKIKYRSSPRLDSNLLDAEYRETDPFYYLDANIRYQTMNRKHSLSLYLKNIGDIKDDIPNGFNPGLRSQRGRYAELNYRASL